MKLQGIRILCLSALVLLLFFACKKTDSSSSGSGHQAEFIKVTLSGRVTDEHNDPISGATVKVTTGSATTDAGGLFTISDVFVDKNATLVKVEKTGFFLGTKTIETGIDKNSVTISLIRKAIAGTFSGASGGNITVPATGGALQFEANSVVNLADNKPYTGSVTVSAFFINPAADNFRAIMPGTLRGITTGNEETGLQSFGMMAVELNGEGGEKLQIAPGKKATLHFPITESLRAQAPATIPLWSLDETTGLWKEEGTATRQGDEYTGSVSHFSFWNCDAPFTITKFTLTVKTQQGQPLADADVVISSGTSDTTSISGSGITNAEGVVSGSIPANRSLQLKIYDKCHNLVHTKNIGPFSTSTDLGVMTVNAAPVQVTFSGTVANCDNTPLANGYVTLELEGIYYNTIVTNGNFSKTVTRCNNAPVTATITAYDVTNSMFGSPVNVDVSGNTVNAGKLSACGIALNTYINYTLSGVSYQITPPTDGVYIDPDHSTNGNFSFVGERKNQNEDILIVGRGTEAPGPHTLWLASVYLNGRNFYKFGEATIDVTEYGPASGGYIAGTFSCKVIDSISTITYPLNCNFRVKR